MLDEISLVYEGDQSSLAFFSSLGEAIVIRLNANTIMLCFLVRESGVIHLDACTHSLLALEILNI